MIYTIDNIDDIKKYCFTIAYDKINAIKLEFQSSYIKQYFFSTIKQYISDVIIINCDSSEERLLSDLNQISRYDTVIFDNFYLNHSKIKINDFPCKKILIISR